MAFVRAKVSAYTSGTVSVFWRTAMSWAAQRLRAEAAQFLHLADDPEAVYQPLSGSPVTLPVIIRTQIGRMTGTGPRPKRDTLIDFRKVDWSAAPVPGDTITSNSVTYAVVGLGQQIRSLTPHYGGCGSGHEV